MEISNVSPNDLKRLTDVMKAIAHPLRLKILCHLRSGPKTVTRIEQEVGKQQALVSQQLKILRLNNLVASDRRGGFSYYELSPDNRVYIETIIDGLCRFCSGEDSNEGKEET